MAIVRYPWDAWVRQLRTHYLYMKRGRDYDCLTRSIMIQFRQAAYARGIKISCQVREQGEALAVWRA